MKGKRKRYRYKVGNRAFSLRYKSIATTSECSSINSVAPSTAPSTHVKDTSSTQVSPTTCTMSKLAFTSPCTHTEHPIPTKEFTWLPRLTEKDFKLYAKESYDGKTYIAPQTENSATAVKLLRPYKQGDDYLDEYLHERSSEVRTLERDLTIDMINKLNICHKISVHIVKSHILNLLKRLREVLVGYW